MGVLFIRRILIVEDDAGIYSALQAYLQRHGFAPQVATTGRDALAQLAATDFVLLDLGLPDMDGTDVLRHLRDSYPHLPVLLLTARTDDTDKIVALELGADDYLTKPFNPRELLARIRAILRRIDREAQPARPDVLECAGIRLDLAAHTAAVDGQPVQLTPREFLLLTAFLRSPGRALTRDDLMTVLWGPDYVGDPKTVDVYVSRLREKVEKDPARPARILTVWGVGYKLAAESNV